ncbi:hypothetical protein DPMN_122851 [Dreissena polymorpha]|uniref:Uncharacterized protein n=1 Tax=Dreissena polymorpha TaxID=45954 RepID=A0A9D4GQG2_DREPO|nr:hypothetical protein DPMN_122851 [Dreissena polymorpha]
METLESGSGRQPASDRDTERIDIPPSRYRRSGLDDPDVCVTVSGIVRQDGEDILTKANDIIKALGNDVLTQGQIMGATRLRSYIYDRPPLIEISFRNVEEKILVFRSKSLLKEKAPYKNVYIKSSKSHAERMIELNARTLG